MRNTIVVLLGVLFTAVSCSKVEQGTLQVINQTDCLHNIYLGVNSGGDFLGAVGANQTNSFVIDVANIVGERFFAADPVNCQGLFEQQFQVAIRDNETSTIIID
ncbi:MAG: hypothetical protein R2730_09720 [Chitinophagales bacterium]